MQQQTESQVEAQAACSGDEGDSSPEHKRGRRAFVRYLAYMLLLPALLYPLAFIIVTIPSYEHWATSQWGPMLEYAFDTPVRNADVVIFGDSSAFLGVDPRILNADLGIKSVVLPDTVGSIPVTGDRPLRDYLQRNRPPRVLVLYFSAWNLDFDNVTEARLFEGEEMMLRHMSGREIASFAWHHPAELPVFPFRFFSTFGPTMVRSAMRHVNREAETASALGHVDYTEPFPPLTAACSIPDNFIAHTATSSVEALARRYATPQTKVLIYLAPIPGCRNSSTFHNRSFAALNAAPPVILPPSSFAGDIYYAHVRPPFVAETSSLLAAALRLRLQGKDTPTVAEPAMQAPKVRP